MHLSSTYSTLYAVHEDNRWMRWLLLGLGFKGESEAFAAFIPRLDLLITSVLAVTTPR